MDSQKSTKSPERTNLELFSVSEIEGYDLVDLLSKLSALHIAVRTEKLNWQGDIRRDSPMIDWCLRFIISFLMTHKVDGGTKEISWRELKKLVVRTCSFFDKGGDDAGLHERRLNRFREHQRDVGRLLPDFFFVPFLKILQCEDELIREKYGTDSDQLFADFILISKRQHNTSEPCIGVTQEYLIDHFYDYFDHDAFEIGKDTQSYGLFCDLAADIGEFDAEEFDATAPIAVLKLRRKIFLRSGESIYCFDYEAIPNLIVRCVERLFQKDGKHANPTWNENMKERTESLTKEVFEMMFSGIVYHFNARYKTNAERECDGIFEYGPYVFIIEAKSRKLNPDPINERNESEVLRSFDDAIGKAAKQCNEAARNILKCGGDFVDSSGRPFKIVSDADHLIKIVLSFEEMSSILPSENIGMDPGSPIFLSFCDLVIILSVCNDPLLVLMYFVDRKTYLSTKFSFPDEIVYLSLFQKKLDYPTAVIEQSYMVDGKEADLVVFDKYEFVNEIALAYTIPDSPKPRVSLGKFQQFIIDIFSSGKIREHADEYMLVAQLKDEKVDQFIGLLMNEEFCRDGYNPVYLYLRKENFAVGLMLAKQCSGEEIYTLFAFAKRFFENRPDIEKIVTVFFEESPQSTMVIQRGQKELYCSKTISEFERIEATSIFERIAKECGASPL